jgi:hypothetical protein
MHQKMPMSGGGVIFLSPKMGMDNGHISTMMRQANWMSSCLGEDMHDIHVIIQSHGHHLGMSCELGALRYM